MEIKPTGQLDDRISLVNATSVLIANALNLSIFKPVWLLKNNLIREDEITENLLISTAVVVIPTEKFELTILPDRLQMRFHPPGYADSPDTLRRIVGGIVETLPHTPFTAVGQNFDYTMSSPAGKQFAEWNRKRFSAPCFSSLTLPPDTDMRFGCYFSFSLLGGRLNVDVKPVQVGTPKQAKGEFSTEQMRFNFNFHSAIPEASPAALILESIAKWEDAFDASSNIVKNLRHDNQST